MGLEDYSWKGKRKINLGIGSFPGDKNSGVFAKNSGGFPFTVWYDGINSSVSIPQKERNLFQLITDGIDTAAGRNPAPVDMGNISLFTGFLYMFGGAWFFPSTVGVKLIGAEVPPFLEVENHPWFKKNLILEGANLSTFMIVRGTVSKNLDTTSPPGNSAIVPFIGMVKTHVTPYSKVVGFYVTFRRLSGKTSSVTSGERADQGGPLSPIVMKLEWNGARPYKWLYKWVTGDITYITLLVIRDCNSSYNWVRGPTLYLNTVTVKSNSEMPKTYE